MHARLIGAKRSCFELQLSRVVAGDTVPITRRLQDLMIPLLFLETLWRRCLTENRSSSFFSFPPPGRGVKQHPRRARSFLFSSSPRHLHASDILLFQVFKWISVLCFSEIVESLLLDVLQPIDLDREKAEDLSPFLSAIYRLVRDIQERLLFRADAFIERHIRSYPAAPTELVAFIFSSLGFPSPARSLPLPDSSLSPASSVFFPVRAALHLATLLRQTVSAEAFGSLCGAALEASCAALSRACLSLEHAVHNGFSPKSCLPPATLEAVQNSATFSSSASPSSLTSSASPDTSPLSSAASASVNLPFHVFLRQLCEARCDAAAGEAGSRLRTARPHPREEDLSPDGEVFSALWAELICTLFLLKHLTVLHSFLDSFRDGDFSPVCRKICFPRMLFAGSRLASAGASGSAGNEGGCEVSPETREKKSEEEGGRKMRFALLSWLFRPEAQEETLDIREVLREETKRRLDGLLATLVAAFALPVEKRLAQLPVAGRLQHEDTANASFVHEQQLKETLEEFQRNLQDQLPAVLLLAILFFDMGEQEGTREQGEGEQEEGEQEEGGRKVHGEMARKWRQREEVLDSMEFLIQPLFSGILSAYKQLGSAVETHVSAETRKAIGWRSAEDLRQSLLLPACAVAFSAAQQFQLSLSPYPK
ncbi:hypothetical protein TGDOM2_306410B [Toxoplasma gondii GAB2-2007-GAL-DOM2]|uniref:Conserved oligomeric Golgi complex subunit 3 C-terminal domain-containing protein n=2 Tax=Toxoplasma gondii TaxID=5811 RepID=A0A086JN35_TOXGO|nr:hypothetical protein TGDOM2_306410B [Toxoplasma gondii GAB2-2007-GAL-DOM2]